MKAIIEIKTPDEACIDDGSLILYITKDEWDNSFYSHRSYDERYFDPERLTHGRASSEPDRFPCIAIQGALIPNSNGHDRISFTFIYDLMLIVKGKVTTTSDIDINIMYDTVTVIDKVTGEKTQSADGTNWDNTVVWKPEMYNSSPGIENSVPNKITKGIPAYEYLNAITDPLEDQKFTVFWKGGGYSIIVGKDINDAFTKNEITCNRHQEVARVVHYTLEVATNYVLDKTTNTFIAQN